MIRTAREIGCWDNLFRPHEGRLLVYARKMEYSLSYELRMIYYGQFPDSVDRGAIYGEACPQTTEFIILDYAQRPGSISGLELDVLARLADELERSISAFPEDARRYCESLLRIARLVLAARGKRGSVQAF